MSNFFTRLLATLTGKKTQGVKVDEFPAPIFGQCVEARTDAVKWYKARYRSEPAIRSVKVMLTDKPPQGFGGLTRASGGGYVIELWRNQRPFYGSLVHEFRHTLALASGKGGGEGAVE